MAKRQQFWVMMELEVVLFKHLLITVLSQNLLHLSNLVLADIVLAPENYVASHPTKLHPALPHISFPVISSQQPLESLDSNMPITLHQCLGRLHHLVHVPCRCDASC